MKRLVSTPGRGFTGIYIYIYIYLYISKTPAAGHRRPPNNCTESVPTSVAKHVFLDEKGAQKGSKVGKGRRWECKSIRTSKKMCFPVKVPSLFEPCFRENVDISEAVFVCLFSIVFLMLGGVL